MVIKVKDGELDLSIIVRHSFRKEGISFFTPRDYSQQLGYMCHPSGYVIDPHVHNPVSRLVYYTQEVLFIRSGLVRVDFFSERRAYLESALLYPGDVILLIRGGHGLVMIEPSEIIEVKQGPYAGEQDKTRFNPNPEQEITFLR